MDPYRPRLQFTDVVPRMKVAELIAAGEHLHDLSQEYALVMDPPNLVLRHGRCGNASGFTQGAVRPGVVPVTDVVLWMLEQHAGCV